MYMIAHIPAIRNITIIGTLLEPIVEVNPDHPAPAIANSIIIGMGEEMTNQRCHSDH